MLWDIKSYLNTYVKTEIKQWKTRFPLYQTYIILPSEYMCPALLIVAYVHDRKIKIMFHFTVSTKKQYESHSRVCLVISAK